MANVPAPQQRRTFPCVSEAIPIRTERDREIVIVCCIIQEGECCWNCTVVGIVIINTICSNTTTASAVHFYFYYVIHRSTDDTARQDLGHAQLKLSLEGLFCL